MSFRFITPQYLNRHYYKFINLKYLMDKENLKKTLEVIAKIVGNDDYFITGSLSLKAYKVIQRASKDLDICVPSDLLLLKLSDEISNNSDFKNRHNGDSEDDQEQRNDYLSFTYLGINTCVFVDSINDFIIIGGYKFTHPKYSIEAKKKYIKNYLDNVQEWTSNAYEKIKIHLEDIKLYQEWQLENTDILQILIDNTKIDNNLNL